MDELAWNIHEAVPGRLRTFKRPPFFCWLHRTTGGPTRHDVPVNVVHASSRLGGRITGRRKLCDQAGHGGRVRAGILPQDSGDLVDLRLGLGAQWMPADPGQRAVRLCKAEAPLPWRARPHDSHDHGKLRCHGFPAGDAQGMLNGQVTVGHQQRRRVDAIDLMQAREAVPARGFTHDMAPQRRRCRLVSQVVWDVRPERERPAGEGIQGAWVASRYEMVGWWGGIDPWGEYT